ncbi:MAG: hypothetical protein PHQ23_04700 [Candidatus Wallbacteria bacterium]|nr:hypothetical protein [Candidatus Wallbacteria bacterium]
MVYQNDTHREVPLYRLDENVTETGFDFDGKIGDLLLGGGGGESAALRIAMPEAVRLFTSDLEDNGFANDSSLYYKSFWSFSDAFVFGDGYQKLGWNPRTCIINWLSENIVAFLLREYPESYLQFAGDQKLTVDGSFLYKPDADDLSSWGSVSRSGK